MPLGPVVIPLEKPFSPRLIHMAFFPTALLHLGSLRNTMVNHFRNR
jgi:hypothetical protein